MSRTPESRAARLSSAAALTVSLAAASLRAVAAGDDVAPEQLPDVVVSAPEPRYVAPTNRDRVGRIWAPVRINGKGPYRLVLDTGASGSAVIQRVVDELGLPVRHGNVRLRGVTGTSIVGSIRVQRLEVGELVVENTQLPIVADAFGGADGVLGIDGFANQRIVIEFGTDRITIIRSRGEPAPAGFTTLPVRRAADRLLRVDALIGWVPVVAIIDTGAQRTVGNVALREALRKRPDPEIARDVIVGVTADTQEGDSLRVPSIAMGSLTVRNAGMTFADLAIFEHWKLTTKPAILIGMDVLGFVDTLIIDYRRRELQIRTRNKP
jgi:predicted aspartyl protease